MVSGNNEPAFTPSLVIGAGIAGSYVESFPPGSVVIARSDCFADMGLDDNGRFIPLFSAGLADPDRPPFSGGRIHCTGRYFEMAAGLMPSVTAATVNMASGSAGAIERIRRAWDPEIETMEGAWLAYTCSMTGIPWLSVRAVSNKVEPRNVNNWDIPLALSNLQEKMIQLLRLISES
jgi:futalosine hydrolase